MKHTIKQIFSTLNTYLFFILFLSFMALMGTLEHQLSFEKVDILNKQKNTINELIKLKKDDIELALIQFNGKSTQLHQEIDKLVSIYKYNVSDKYIFNNQLEYLTDLENMRVLTTQFNKNAQNFYLDTNTKSETIVAEATLLDSFYKLNNTIDAILIKNSLYNKNKFELILKMAIMIFLLVISATFWYRKKLYNIYKDIEFLYQIDRNKISHEIYTMEADAISIRLNKKVVVNDNPSMLDPVTGINNHKGMISSYSNKKNLQDSNFTSVTIIEIDDFSKSKRAFSQEVTQGILKKVAYTLSLHEQAVDVIARTDYNQFTLVFSRPSKEQCFKDMDLIRQSIEELKFNIPNKGTNNITVSGGFVVKPNNTNLEEAIKKAKEILESSKSIGINKIFQLRDLERL